MPWYCYKVLHAGVCCASRGDSYVVDMIATSEPIYDFPLLGESTSGKNWTDLLKILSAETSNVMRFKLSWDPFRAPDEKQVSRYTPSVSNIRTQWDAILEKIKDAGEMGDNSHNCHTHCSYRRAHQGHRRTPPRQCKC